MCQEEWVIEQLLVFAGWQGHFSNKQWFRWYLFAGGFVISSWFNPNYWLHVCYCWCWDLFLKKNEFWKKNNFLIFCFNNVNYLFFLLFFSTKYIFICIFYFMIIIKHITKQQFLFFFFFSGGRSNHKCPRLLIGKCGMEWDVGNGKIEQCFYFASRRINKRVKWQRIIILGPTWHLELWYHNYYYFYINFRSPNFYELSKIIFYVIIVSCII